MKVFKKSALLIALAAAAFGAQAAEVYGTADVAYTYTDVAGADGHALSSGGKSDSFIGFKAGEDLGSGLKASVVLEAGYDLDTGATGAGKLFNREASLGLTSGANAVKFGRLQSPGFATVQQFDAFGGSNLGRARGISNVAEFNDNAVGYSYTHGDVSVALQHAFGEEVDGGLRDGATTALGVTYAHGPLSAALTRTDVEAGARTTQVAGAYDFGVVKASLLVQDASNSALDNSFLFGVKAPVSGFVAQASLGQAKLNSGDKVDLYSFGGEYNLSKRTNLYAAYGRIEASEAKGEQFAVGMNHSF